MAEIVEPSVCLLEYEGEPWPPSAPFDLEDAGYILKKPAIKFVSLSSLMFASLTRQVDLVILSARYFHLSQLGLLKKSINAVGEARAHGCKIIIYGLEASGIAEGLRDSALSYLKEFAVLSATQEEAVIAAVKMLDPESQKKEDAIAVAIEDGRHARTEDSKGRSSISLRAKNFSFDLPIMSGLAVPHPFDGDDLGAKLRFIIGYSNDYVAVCGITREYGDKTSPGYVVKEEELDLPSGWREKWKSGVLFSGAMAVKHDDWTFAWPSMEMKPDLMIVGGIEYQINGRCVVQRTPYCLCTLVKPEEMSDVEA
jgi:hypothetical protein